MRDLRWLLCGVACALSACTTILPTSEEGQAHSTVLLQQQAAQASARLRAGGMATPMLYAGFALNNQSTAFQGDVLRLSEIAAQLSPNSPQLLFSNAQEQASRLSLLQRFQTSCAAQKCCRRSRVKRKLRRVAIRCWSSCSPRTAAGILNLAAMMRTGTCRHTRSPRCWSPWKPTRRC